MTKRWLFLALPPLVFLAAAFVLVQLFLDLDEDGADRKAAERLTLYRQTILGEYQKYRYLPYMIARDPRATSALATGRPDETANRFLQEMADNSGADLLYVMNRDGTTLAASNWRDELSLVGRNYAFRPYFKSAIEGAEGQFFAIGATLGEPGLFLSRPTPVSGTPTGVAVVKVDMRPLEAAWAEGGETVFASDENGVIFLSSRPEWRYRTLAELPSEVRETIDTTRQYATQELDPVSDQPVSTSKLLTIDGNLFRHNAADVGLLGWTLHFLVPLEETRKSVLPIWTVAIALCLVYAIILLVLRGRRLRKTSVQLRQESADLKQLNSRLVGEIQERRRIARELLEAQRGLARSNRLAAVGEMSAAVVHELSQPLAAALVEDEQELGADALSRIALLNQQLRALRRQIGALEQALEASESRDRESQTQLADLGRRLNVALAQRVQILNRFRSDFFGRLRDILAERSGSEVVGDRFVFQSEVLFPSGSDALNPAGQEELAKLASELTALEAEIPDDIDWVLRVDGHTDSRPITGGGRFRSNWDLSAARAISVVQFLIDQGVSPLRLVAAGFGEFQPIIDEENQAAYDRNRRIELKLTQR